MLINLSKLVLGIRFDQYSQRIVGKVQYLELENPKQKYSNQTNIYNLLSIYKLPKPEVCTSLLDVTGCHRYLDILRI